MEPLLHWSGFIARKQEFAILSFEAVGENKLLQSFCFSAAFFLLAGKSFVKIPLWV